MRRFYVVGFLGLMAFDTIAQLCFKMAGMHALPVAADAAWLGRIFSQPWVYGSIAGYLGAFFTWMTLLRRAPIGPAFAASHLDVVSVLLVSHWLLGDALTTGRVVGAVVILAGILCLASSEQDDGKPTG